MIYQKLIITDQSYEVSCQGINFVSCPMRFSCPAEKINQRKLASENVCSGGVSHSRLRCFYLFVYFLCNGIPILKIVLSHTHK